MKYGRAILAALQSRGLAIRQLANAVGHSYEHCRRIIKGDPVVSEELNKEICRVLGLDEQEMWRQAQKEKAVERFGVRLPSAGAGDAQALIRAWKQLGPSDRRLVLRVAQAMAQLARRENVIRRKVAPGSNAAE